MWLEIDQTSFRVRQQGLERRRAAGGAELYVSPGNAGLFSVRDLAAAEYCHAVEVDPLRRTVSFGRDYLGHYPLLYAQAGDSLFVSDEFAAARRWAGDRGAKLALSEEALALYFAMGYVPQGMTLYDEIKTCRNATLYHWQAGRVKEERVFQPVAAEAGFPVAELGAQIEAQFRAMGARGKADVWCSGGLDSSIVAVLCQSSGALGDLLTLSYEDALQCDASELRFAHDVSQHLGAKLRYAKLTRQRYRDAFRHCASLHPGPVVDYLVPLKYALAGASQGRALTGEGGDPLFSGPKNNFVLYVTSRQPGMPLGKVHALAHKRLYEYMPRFLKRGAELAQYAEGYLADLLERYPGDLLRKLFYVNTFEKQGGMIFPKNYYAGRCHGVEVLHPLASLEVYRAAFRLPDHRKYVYPAGKLALLDLYAGALPATVVQRRKSGTRLPLEAYLGYLLEDGAGVGLLKDASVFRADALDELTCEGPRRRSDLVLLYGLLSLGAWLAGNGAATAAVH